MAETIVPEAQVREFLGITTPKPVLVAPLAKMARAVQLRVFNDNGHPFVALRDLERALRSFADGNPPVHDLLHSVADQIVGQCNRQPQRLAEVG